jgi:hypothetical protein
VVFGVLAVAGDPAQVPAQMWGELRCPVLLCFAQPLGGEQSPKSPGCPLTVNGTLSSSTSIIGGLSSLRSDPVTATDASRVFPGALAAWFSERAAMLAIPPPQSSFPDDSSIPAGHLSNRESTTGFQHQKLSSASLFGQNCRTTTLQTRTFPRISPETTMVPLVAATPAMTVTNGSQIPQRQPRASGEDVCWS